MCSSDLYRSWFRSFGKHDPEPWGALYQAFFWGAITGIILAGIVNGLLVGLVFLAAGAAVAAVVGPVVIAPFVEEYLKALGLMRAGVKQELECVRAPRILLNGESSSADRAPGEKIGVALVEPHRDRALGEGIVQILMKGLVVGDAQ